MKKKYYKTLLLILCFGLISILSWHFFTEKNIDKIIFRGVYKNNQTEFKGDTLFITKNEKQLDTILKLFHSAKEIKNVKPFNIADEFNISFQVYFYSGKVEKNKITIRPQFNLSGPYYFEKNQKKYDGSGLQNFMIKMFRNKYGS